MDWETLDERPAFVLRRCGRFLVAELIGPHRVLSTSARNGGQVDHVRVPRSTTRAAKAPAITTAIG